MARTTAPIPCLKPVQAAAIRSEMKALRKMTKSYLAGEVRRHHRVVDLHDADKGTLVAMLLEAEFGWRRLEAFDAGRICKDG